jgi:hypothetical protein
MINATNSTFDKAPKALNGIRVDFSDNIDLLAVIDDFGILKWSTSAVCFGPPWAQQTSTLDLSVSLDLEAGVGLESQGGAIRADSVGI